LTPATGTALLILAVFVLPGFVTLLIRERTYTIPSEQKPFERLLRALYYAALVYGIAIGLGAIAGLDKNGIEDVYTGRRPLGHLMTAAILVVLIIPLIIAEGGRYWRLSPRREELLGRLRISVAHDIDSGWNQAFSSSPDVMFVRITTNDSRVIGGLFGPGSLAGYSEQAQDLYLAQRWELDDDDWFLEPAAGTLGVWVPKDNIASLELYRVGSEPSDDTTDGSEA
jgi:di/tricarboxylate transporter